MIYNNFAGEQFEESGAIDLKFNSWKDFNQNIIMIDYKNPYWNFTKFMKFSVLDFPLMMERGYLPLRVDYFDSVDGFYGGFGLKTKGIPIRNIINTTDPNKPGPFPGGTDNPNPNEPQPPDPSVVPENSDSNAQPDPNTPVDSGSDSGPFETPSSSSFVPGPEVDPPP